MITPSQVSSVIYSGSRGIEPGWGWSPYSAGQAKLLVQGGYYSKTECPCCELFQVAQGLVGALFKVVHAKGGGGVGLHMHVVPNCTCHCARRLQPSWGPADLPHTVAPRRRGLCLQGVQAGGFPALCGQVTAALLVREHGRLQPRMSACMLALWRGRAPACHFMPSPLSFSYPCRIRSNSNSTDPFVSSTPKGEVNGPDVA